MDEETSTTTKVVERVDALREAFQGKAKIASALVKAQAAVRPAEKSGENTYDKYNYSKYEDLHAVAQAPLADNELCIVYEEGSLTRLPNRTTQAGKLEFCVQIEIIAILMHSSGESLIFHGYGEGQDRGDKAVYKAITGAKKYLLSNILNIPSADDPEKDSHESDVSMPMPPGTIPPKKNIGEQFAAGKLNPVYQKTNGLISPKQIAEIEKAVAATSIAPPQLMYWINKHFNQGKPTIDSRFNIKAEWFDTILLFLKDKPDIIKNEKFAGDDVIAVAAPTPTPPASDKINQKDAEILKEAFQSAKITKEGALAWLRKYLDAANIPFEHIFDLPKASLPEILEIVRHHNDTIHDWLTAQKSGIDW